MWFSYWTEILAGVPQDSILGLLLFNMFLSIFLFITNSNYVDNNTL